MQLQAARRARRTGKAPALCQDWDTRDEESRLAFLRNIPNLGDYVAPGWKPLQDFFVSKIDEYSDGRSLGSRDLAAALKPGLGYGITQEGEFQVYVTSFQRLKVRYE
jgi:hypothetical protein